MYDSDSHMLGSCSVINLNPHTAFQHGIVKSAQQKAIPSNFTLMPEKLKELGYSTHMVGK